MSIDLSIDNLTSFRIQLDDVLARFIESKESCEKGVGTLNEGWNAPSYAAFRNEVYFIFNGVYTQALDDTKVLSEAIAEVEEKAKELKGRTEAMPDILLTGSMGSSDSCSGILFCDDDQLSSVESTILSAESTSIELSQSFALVANGLLDLRTTSVDIDAGKMNGFYTDLYERLCTLRSALSTFKADVADMEVGFDAKVGEIAGDRFFASETGVLINDNPGNRDAALVLFMTPDHLLTNADRRTLDQLKEKGHTLEGLLGSQGVSVYTGIGIVEDVHKGLFKIAEGVIDLNGFKQGAKVAGKLGRGIPGLGSILGFADAALTYDAAYANTPHLAESRRISDAQVEVMISAGESFVLSIASWGLTAIFGTIGSAIMPGPGSAVGTGVGILASVGVSVAYTVNSEQLQAETIRKQDWAGLSPVGILKDWHYG